MHLTIKERVELVLMSGADGVCYYYLNCFICFGALFRAQNVCYYYLNCFICFGALFMAQNVCYYYLNCFICFGALFMAHPVQVILILILKFDFFVFDRNIKYAACKQCSALFKSLYEVRHRSHSRERI